MKIAILADPLDNQYAGIHTYVSHLVKTLVESDTENEYLIVREKIDPNLQLKQLAVPNIRLPIGFSALRKFFIIPLLLRFKKVDAVFEPAHFGPFNLPKRIKRITMIHDLTPILLPQFHHFQSQFLQRIFLNRILKKTNLILTNSQNTRKDLIQIFPFAKSKSKTILLGRDKDFRPLSSKEYLETNGITEPYFICAGTIEPRKNLGILLDAYQLFRKEINSKILLIIVGKKGWKSDNFYSKLENHPFRKDIILTGYVTKQALIELYSNSLALVYPSLYEGFGLPILEAMSCGTNVICSNNSSLPEVGGKEALYFDPKNKTDLFLKLVSVFKNYNEGQNQKESLMAQAEKFSWDNYVNVFEETINDI